MLFRSVERIRNGEIPETAFATVPAPCPKCGGTIQENYRKFQCQSCDFAIWKVTSGREWSPEEIAERPFHAPVDAHRKEWRIAGGFRARGRIPRQDRLRFLGLIHGPRLAHQ